jgi:hypothetical protein
LQCKWLLMPENGHQQTKLECLLRANSGFMQCSKKAGLFDHLVGAAQKRRRHFETQCLCRFDNYHQFKLDRGLNGKVTRLRSLEDVIECLTETFSSAGAP